MAQCRAATGWLTELALLSKKGLTQAYHESSYLKCSSGFVEFTDERDRCCDSGSRRQYIQVLGDF